MLQTNIIPEVNAMTIGTYVAATEKISVIKIESRVNILLPFYMNNVHMPNRHEIVAKGKKINANVMILEAKLQEIELIIRIILIHIIHLGI